MHIFSCEIGQELGKGVKMFFFFPFLSFSEHDFKHIKELKAWGFHTFL